MLVVLGSALAGLATPASAGSSAERVGGGHVFSYIVVLRDQQSHAASVAVRAAMEPALNALADRRTALVGTIEDVQSAEVADLNSQIDAMLGEMRFAIALEASRRHAPTRSIVGAAIADLGGEVTYEGPVLNLLVARLPSDTVAVLETHPLVAAVEPDRAMDALLDISVPATGATSFWTGGSTGWPFELADPDTGVDRNHTALLGKISDERVFHAAARLQGDYADNPNTADDIHGHGTHIAGIMASQDATYRGLAYGLLGVINAKWGYLTNTGNGRGIWSDGMRALDWAILTAGADVVSFSFGGGSNDNGNSAEGLFFDALVDDLGVPVSVAAGNSGPGGGTLGIPATSYNIMTVGATDDRNTVARGDDGIAGFSSRGPTGDGRIKPDIAAPGSDIVSTAHNWEAGNPDWVAFWGTSMAAPHVGAGFILYLQATGGPAFPARSKAVFLNTATDLGNAGPDNTYGWGSMDLSLAWARRNNVVDGTVGVSASRFFRLAGVPGDRATLVWQKHVVYNGISNPNTWWNLNNLDLALYDEFSGGRLDTSISTRDNVEQVAFASATTGIAKVYVTGSLQGVTQDPFALAGVQAPVPVSAPSLFIALSAPTTVNQGQTFVVQANVTNTGGLRVYNTAVTLAVPPNLNLVSGANPASLGAIAQGTTRTASWTLTGPIPGTYPISASANGDAFDDLYSGTSNLMAVTVLDTEPPTIAGPSASPSPQNPGQIVNISAGVSDNVAVDGTWVEVWDPTNANLGNFSMPFDPITGRSFFVRPYSTLGDYLYTISAVDTTSHWATAGGAFRIEDMIRPTLSNVLETPDPQEVHFAVNVTATATDNVGVVGAFFDVVDPLGGSMNATMGRQGTTVFVDRVYDLLGTYTYTISVHDAALNWATATSSFVVRDTTAPLADAGPDRGGELGFPVLFDGSGSTDNAGIVSYVWTFVDGSLVTLNGPIVNHSFATLGSHVVTLTVRDASGNQDTDFMTALIVDPRPPTIDDVRADPPLQDVGGAVEVSAVITDLFGVAGGWLRVVDPGGTTVNVTMSPAAGRYGRSLTYREKGVHVFEIWASDLNANWASASGAFVIADLSPPVVSGLAATPDPQDVFGTVDVAASVTDNDAVADVWLEVRNPAGATVATIPMALTAGQYRANFVPGVLGGHGVTVWAADPTGNLGSAGGRILSVDRAPPILAVNAPPSAEVLTIFPVDVTASDNLGTFVATLEVRDPSGASLGNRTLAGGSPYTASWWSDRLGPHVWTAWAVDPSGNGIRLEGVIDVQDTQAPVAAAGPDRIVWQGTHVPLDGSGSTDNYGIATHTWTFAANGKNQVLRGDRTTFAFHQAGTYEVRLNVVDLAGNVGEDTATILVMAADADADGLTEDEERLHGTDPTRPDTDGDGLPDGADANPTTPDIDVQGLFFSWYGILLLAVILLVVVAAAMRRPKEKPKASPPRTAPKVAKPPPPVAPALPPPPDDDLPPPPSD